MLTLLAMFLTVLGIVGLVTLIAYLSHVFDHLDDQWVEVSRRYTKPTKLLDNAQGSGSLEVFKRDTFGFTTIEYRKPNGKPKFITEYGDQR